MSAWSAARILQHSSSWVSPWRPSGSRSLVADGYEMYLVGGAATLTNWLDLAPGRVRSAVQAAAGSGAVSLDVTISPEYPGSGPVLYELAELRAVTIASDDILAVDLLTLPASLGGAESAVGVIEVNTAGEVDDFERTSALAWGYPAPSINDLADAQRRLTPGWFLAYLGQNASGTAGFAMVEDVARFWGAAVVPEHRGCGVYRALVTTRAAVARERGAGLALVHAGPASSPILRHLGFRSYGRRMTFRVPIDESMRGKKG